MSSNKEKPTEYEKGSLSLPGAVAMGTGVMIGAGIFALTGQIAELGGTWFPFAFLLAAVVSGFSAYTYVKMSDAYPSAGGIAMFLKKAYSKSTITGASALLMFFSMVINQSLGVFFFWASLEITIPSGNTGTGQSGKGMAKAKRRQNGEIFAATNLSK